MESRDKYIIGVDVGGTNIRVGRMRGYEIEGLVKAPLTDVLSGEKQPEKLAHFISDYCRNLPVAAVAVGLPGTLDRDCRRVLKTPNIPGLSGSDLKSIMQTYFQVPFFLENDAVMLLSGDIYRLELDRSGVYLGCYIGTGLGSALYIDGAVPKGANGISEMGHMPVFGKDELCSCGNRGCAENYVSGRYLQKLRSEKYPDIHISDIFTAIKGSEEYFEYIEILSVILSCTVNLLDPHALIIGGGVVSMRNFPKEELFDRVRYHAMKPVPAESLKILCSPEKDDAGVFGAAVFARRRLEMHRL